MIIRVIQNDCVQWMGPARLDSFYLWATQNVGGVPCCSVQINPPRSFIQKNNPKLFSFGVFRTHVCTKPSVGVYWKLKLKFDHVKNIIPHTQNKFISWDSCSNIFTYKLYFPVHKESFANKQRNVDAILFPQYWVWTNSKGIIIIIIF